MNYILHIVLAVTACGSQSKEPDKTIICWSAAPLYFSNQAFNECRAFSYSFCGTQSEYNTHIRVTDEGIEAVKSEGFSEITPDSYNENCQQI